MEAPKAKKLSTSDMARAKISATEKDLDSPNPRHDIEEHAIPANAPTAAPHASGEDQFTPLLSPDRENDYRSRWKSIQTEFVDEPRRAVEQADELVAQIMQNLAQGFSEQRSRLESEWDHSEQASTEDLRLALRRYRSFFDRLLSM